MAELRDDPDTGRLLDGPFDPETGDRYRRRMTEQRIRGIADSAVLKIIMYVITGLMFPMILWSINAFTDRLEKIEDAINRNATMNATVELRLQSIERTNIDRDAGLRDLTDRTTSNSYRIQAIEQELKRATGGR